MSPGSSRSLSEGAHHFPTNSFASQDLAPGSVTSWTDFQVHRRDSAAPDAAPYLLHGRQLESDAIKSAIEGRLRKGDAVGGLQFAEEHLDVILRDSLAQRLSNHDVAEAHTFVAQCYKELRDYSTAQTYYKNALDYLSVNVPSSANERIEVLGDLVVCAYRTKNVDASKRVYEDMLSEYAAIQEPKPETIFAVSEAAAQLGSHMFELITEGSPEEVAANGGRERLLVESEKYLRQSLHFERRDSAQYLAASTALGMLLVHLERNREAAEVWIQAAENSSGQTELERIAGTRLRIVAAELLIDDVELQGAAEELLATARAALVKPKTLDDKYLLIKVLSLQAESLLQIDQVQEAYQLFEEARVVAASTKELGQKELEVLSELCTLVSCHGLEEEPEVWLKRGIELSAEIFGARSFQLASWQDRYIAWLGTTGSYRAEAVALRQRIEAIESPSPERVALYADLARNYGDRKLYGQQDLNFSLAWKEARLLPPKERQCLVGLLIQMAYAERLKIELHSGGADIEPEQLRPIEKLLRLAVRHADRFIDQPLLKVEGLTELGRFLEEYGDLGEAEEQLKVAIAATELAYGPEAVGPERVTISEILVDVLIRQSRFADALREWKLADSFIQRLASVEQVVGDVHTLQYAMLMLGQVVLDPNEKNGAKALGVVDRTIADFASRELDEIPVDYYIKVLEVAEDVAAVLGHSDRQAHYRELLSQFGEVEEGDDEG